MKRNLAISIGINKYEFSQPLKYAKRDAELMRDFLVKEAGFERVLFCSDESPSIKGKSTRASFINLRRVLRKTFEKPFMEAGDNFWFFFSGHGMRHNGCDYLMACDSDPGDVVGTAISISYVTEQLRRCGADNVVLILDACRSQGSKSGEGIGYQAAQVAREKGVITIFSCSPDELSYEINDLQQGIFTKALLEGLGAQGRCATVERLNHYLNGRVPDLIRQYKKGDTSRQTPYIIAEPASKYHLILCPQYATLNDVATMKNDAFSAEIHKDFDLAEQLWIRVLAASPGGDMDAVKALKRIGIAETQPAAIPYEPSSKNSATTDKSPEPAPPNPTPIEHDVSPSCENSAKTEKSPEPAPPNPTPIEHDVPLKSERGVDYTKLRDLLAIGKWKEADLETAYMMLEGSGKTREGRLNSEDIYNFPCENLRTIDQLWVKYSNGRFGFSVQKRIYESLGGTKEYDHKSWEAFGERVGWRVNGRVGELKFASNAPIGHLPLVFSGWFLWGWRVKVVFSRVETCKLHTTVPLPIPISANVPLKSERGVDYTKLRDLLATGKWQEADEETANKMVEVTGRREDGWLRVEDLDRFPCEDLRTIDQLWVKYSNGHFGFSVQKRIYESLGGTRKYDSKIWEAFGDLVGWRVNNKWLYCYNDLKFNIKAPEGHLPCSEGKKVEAFTAWKGRLVRGAACAGLAEFFSRVETCNVAVDDNETSSQPSSIISSSNSVCVSAGKQSPQSRVFSTPTTVPLPTPIEPDVRIKSERRVDYTKLRDLLARRKWKEADKETMNKMLEVAGRTKDGWLIVEDIDLFPCEDLRIIDRLWVKNSNGRFGFSVQKRIYESLGGTREYNRKIWEAFGDRVGWRVNNKWLGYEKIKYKYDTPGTFPARWTEGMWMEDRWTEEILWEGDLGCTFFSRVETCKV